MTQLSPTDSQMLHMETRNSPNHLATLMLFDQSTAPGGKVRFKDIMGEFDVLIDHVPRFRQKLLHVPLSLDDPYFVDDPYFDIEFHVRHLALPKPGDQRQLCIQIARLMSRTLDPSRPMWEAYIIEGLDNVEGVPAGSFALFIKMHHSMIDGMGVIAMINAMLSEAPQPYQARKSTWVAQSGPGSLEMLGMAWFNTVTRPGKTFMRFAPMATGLIREKLGAPEIKTTEDHKTGLVAPMTPLNGKLTSSRVFDYRSYTLAQIKQIRVLAAGSTINDVVIALVAGCMRRYLKLHDALPEKSLVTTVPISIRSEATKGNASGNEVTAANVPLFTDLDDPVERLDRIRGWMQKVKESQNTVSAQAMVEMSNAMPGMVAGTLFRAVTAVAGMTGTQAIANTTVTNVPGPQKPMYFLGARLAQLGGCAPVIANMGVLHCVGSYDGSLTLNMNGCRDLLPDPEVYMDCLDQSFSEYMKLSEKAA
jgi:diacylglycerol O-acyltransferase / wax synthase